MMSILFTIISFIVAISILVGIHEFGHYIVAKKLGVKILRFSIGFGKPLWMKRFGKDQTEFVIASIPLGGYVKMLDKREGGIDTREKHREFTGQSVWTRIAIVFAGPAFNFLFAVFAYWLMFIVGITGVKPIIGNVENNSLADKAGLVSGYEIVAINNNKTPLWGDVIENMVTSQIDRSQVVLELKNKQGNTITRTLDFSATTGEIKIEKIFTQLGFEPWRPAIEPVVGMVGENTPAENAGFKIDDKIISINKIATPDWNDVIKLVSARPAEIIQVVILRNGQQKTIQVIPEKIVRNGEAIGRLGLANKAGSSYPKGMHVTHGYDPVESIPNAISRTWDKTILTLKFIGKLLTGEISVTNLSSPIGIAKYAGYSASAGFSRFLDFLAFLSVSLGVLNLLPIPILDGGHLTYYMIEVVRRKPVSEETQEFASRIGMILLFSLMAVALYNDILRVVG